MSQIFCIPRAYKACSLALTCFILSACQSLIVHEEKDSGPDRSVDVSHIAEPVPRHEVRTIAGNKTPYRVLGKTYHVMPQPEGFKQQGFASWYGKKFHGRRTSNGELYDMFGMTAAHKTLPIPSYVTVTNLENQRSVIVRVNDRGPFHGDRVIDLTYSAAKKLGFVNRGTARVEVAYIDPSTHKSAKTPVPAAQASGEPKAPAPLNSAGYALPPNTYLQVGAFSRESAAQRVKDDLVKVIDIAVVVVSPPSSKDLYKVQIGPFTDNLTLQNTRQRVIDANYPAPHAVYR